MGIKASLTSGRKKSPQIRLRMPFDRLTFDGGLKARAVEAGGSIPSSSTNICKIYWEDGITEDSMNMEISALSYSGRYASTYTKDDLLLIINP